MAHCLLSKQSFIRTQRCPFVSSVVATETVWPVTSKIFTNWTLQEKSANSYSNSIISACFIYYWVLILNYSEVQFIQELDDKYSILSLPPGQFCFFSPTNYPRVSIAQGQFFAHFSGWELKSMWVV